jgi:hypothetical protein
LGGIIKIIFSLEFRKIYFISSKNPFSDINTFFACKAYKANFFWLDSQRPPVHLATGLKKYFLLAIKSGAKNLIFPLKLFFQ